MDESKDVKSAVREHYAQHAVNGTSCCGSSVKAASACCRSTPSASGSLGYSAEDLAAVPEGADLGLGCGNPFAMLELKEGETVLDLGSGAGIDCFIAARRVGETGRVIGVDMTPEMLDRARRNAQASGFPQVEFRLGELEHLPVADGEVDAIISNCVINLVPDKAQVFREAFRVLKPGGRLSVSDIVLIAELPPFVRGSIEAYVTCLAGAIPKDEYLGLLRAAGFSAVMVEYEQRFALEDLDSPDFAGIDIPAEASRNGLECAVEAFASVRVKATK
ncbi:MAG: arsenite methyltransferase [Coriobacteriia bacterium]